MSEIFEFKEFKVESKRYMRVLWRHVANDHWWWVTAIVAGCCSLIAIDVRYLLVAAMLIFLLLPMAMTMVYITYTFTPEVRWSLLEKNAVIDRDGIHMSFTDERMHDHTIEWATVRSVVMYRGDMVFRLAGRRYNYWILPGEAVNTLGERLPKFKQFLADALTQVPQQ